MTKVFAAQGKEKKPRDIMYALKTGDTNTAGEPIYKRNSHKMAEQARNYHEALQDHEYESHPRCC
jgi:hypothetical protein